MSKRAKDWDKAVAQVNTQIAQPGLAAAEAESTREHLGRKDVGADFNGKDNRVVPDDAGTQSNRKRHLATKNADNGDAIADLSAVVSRGQAIGMVDPKRGNRAPRTDDSGIVSTKGPSLDL